MSLIAATGTWLAMMLRRHPGPKSKKKILPLPSSTMTQGPAWENRGGKGWLPMKMMRISSGPRSSLWGK
jgi:hypothetical protein